MLDCSVIDTTTPPAHSGVRWSYYQSLLRKSEFEFASATGRSQVLKHSRCLIRQFSPVHLAVKLQKASETQLLGLLSVVPFTRHI